MDKSLTTLQAKSLALADVSALVDDWLRYERDVNDVSENTVKTYRKGMDVFVEWLENKGVLGDVSPSDVADFKGDLKRGYTVERIGDDGVRRVVELGPYAVQTVNLRLTAVRSFYRYAVKKVGRMAYNPAREIRGIKRNSSKSHKRDALTNGEVLEVLATCDTGTLEGIRDRAILGLFTRCALRSVEVHRANLGDLRTRSDRLTLDVRSKGTKTPKDKRPDEYVIVPLDEEPIIRLWLSHRMTFKNNSPDDPLFISFSNRSRGGRLSLRAIRYMVKERYRSVGVVGEAKTTHSLRHSTITNAIRRGATPMQVQSMARHKSFDTTLGYFHEVDRLDNPAEDLVRYE